MIFAPIKWKKELIDQSLHALLAVALMVAFVLPNPPWIAAIFVVLVAFVRELDQHKWNWRAVGRLDMCVWTSSAVLFAIFY